MNNTHSTFHLIIGCVVLFISAMLHSQNALSAPGDILFSDDFERNALGPDWSTSSSQRAGIGTYTANSGTRSLYTRWGAVDVTSKSFDLSTVGGAELSMWIRIGDDIVNNFSEYPDSAGEDLVIQYLNSSSSWVTLETFVGGNEAPGAIFNRTYKLPSNALHPNFKIRISQTGGSGNNYDYYHIDDVKLTETAAPPTLSYPFCDDFESGLGNWEVTATTGDAGIGSQTYNSAGNSLYLRWGNVYVSSLAIDTSAATTPYLSLWLRRGSDTFSENPDNGEDLRIEYLNSSNVWTTLDTFPGSGTPGEILQLGYALPADAIHSGFKVRFHMLNGSGSGNNGIGYDYWHIDDVCVKPQPAAPTCSTYRDEFSTPSYSRNDGSANWSTNWIETGDNGNPANGTIQINNLGNIFSPDYRLQLEGNGSGGSATFGGPSIEREADLSSYSTATLSFDYSESGNWEGNDIIEVWVSSNGGSTWTLIHQFKNDQGSTPQTFTYDISSYISNNFRVAFVEKANAADEIFYIDNVQIEACSTTTLPDHFRFEHDGSGLTCNPENIVVRACMDAACTTEYSGPIAATLSPSGWVGGDTQTFNSGATLQLWHTTPGIAALDISSTLGAANPPQCYVSGVQQANCNLTFADSGFIFDVPNHTSATPQSVQLSAVRKDITTQQCVPTFQNVTKDLDFWSTYSNPASGTLPVSINGTNIATATPGTGISLTFDANGQTTFTLNYPDVGSLQLDASYTGSGNESGLIMTGQDSFVVKPAWFALSNIQSDTGTSNPAAADATGAAFAMAGQAFNVTITAKNALGQTTPNFGQESTPETVQMGAPGWNPLSSYAIGDVVVPRSPNGFSYKAIAAGSSSSSEPSWPTTAGNTVTDGGVTWTTYSNYLPKLIAPINGNNPALATVATSSFTNGTATGSYSWSEVGIISLTPHIADGDYLGAGDIPVLSSGNIGRFYPASLSVSHTHHAACNDATAEAFTYAGLASGVKTGQPFTVDGTITALNLAGATTQNYVSSATASADFAKLTPSSITATPNGGTGSITSWSVGPLNFTAGLSNFSAQATYGFTAVGAPQNVYLDVQADDGEASGNESDSSKIVQYRFGRLLVLDAYGPQTSNLDVPLVAQYHNGTDYVDNTIDTCTGTFTTSNVSLADVSPDTDSLDVAGGDTSVLSITSTLATGLGSITLSAPGPGTGADRNEGTAITTLDLSTLSWLRDDTDGDGNYDNDPVGNATFGNYRGDDRFLFWKETQ